MKLSEFLAAEWRPALGCTEPAAIAWAAATAAAQSDGPVRAVHLVCDPRTYKNCYAVGIPNSGRQTGILWAMALGAFLPDASRQLECFADLTPAIVKDAGCLVESGGTTVEVEPRRECLYIDCKVARAGGFGRAVVEREHSRMVRVERGGAMVASGGWREEQGNDPEGCRNELAAMGFDELIGVARSITEADRHELRRGAALNLAIARHGLSLFPPRFVDTAHQDSMTRFSRLVCAGVHARMSGEPFVVMSLAGSGNKGITTSVPITLWGRESGATDEQVDEALALGCLVTSSVTRHLGSLSAACGAAIAAGMGVAAGLVWLEGGRTREIELATTNIVGNLTGMICDGAKIGCGLKTMTGVDAAFRAASLALAGIGIPSTDGILGHDTASTMANLGRIANRGMASMDAEILGIMQEKLRAR